MKAWTIAGIMMFCAAQAFAAEQPADFAYGAVIDADGSEALYEVVAPVTLYEGVARADLGDVRVDQRGGGIGSGLPQIQAGWLPHRLVFSARGAPPFLLAYGNGGAKPAAFAIETLVPGYREDAVQPVKAAKTSAAQKVNVRHAAAFPQNELGGAERLRAAIDWKRWSLWGALVVGVLILGAMAWRLMRQLAAGAKAAERDDATK